MKSIYARLMVYSISYEIQYFLKKYQKDIIFV